MTNTNIDSAKIAREVKENNLEYKAKIDMMRKQVAKMNRDILKEIEFFNQYEDAEIRESVQNLRGTLGALYAVKCALDGAWIA